MKENNLLMTLAEVASYLKIAERTVLRLVHKGALPGTKVGSQWRFFRSLIDDWLITNTGKRHQVNMNREILLSRALKPRYVILSLKPGNQEEIFQQLLAPLVTDNIISTPYLIINKLIDREKISSTAIGQGVALPHLRDPRDNPDQAPQIIAGVCREGVEFNAIDGQPVSLFFLLCSNQEPVHLTLMAKLSHLLLDRDLRESLNRAETQEAFVSLISEKELSQ